ncbi:hypothetical protein [Aestuariivirga sp.]|uniref:hypothetical protein n=1 Tax=Aestuariivirga sp. TaxID=2650926 RepID=UPI0035946C22
MGNSTQQNDPKRDPQKQKAGQHQGGDVNRGREQQNQQDGGQRQQSGGIEHENERNRHDQNQQGDQGRDNVQR